MHGKCGIIEVFVVPKNCAIIKNTGGKQMNKQELSSRIWQTNDDLRASMKASEYKDYIATMKGAIPKGELKQFKDIFEVLPGLYDELFNELNENYLELKTANIHELLANSPSVDNFNKKYNEVFAGFGYSLDELLIEHAEEIHPQSTKDDVVNMLFERFEIIPLVDKYKAHQIFNVIWTGIVNDIEVIQGDSFNVAARAVDPNMVIKKRQGIDTEIQDGWKGRIIPFELVQETLLKEEAELVRALEGQQFEIQEELHKFTKEIIEELTDESVKGLLHRKWIKPIEEGIQSLADQLFEDLDIGLTNLANKYEQTMQDIQEDNKNFNEELIKMMA